MARWLINLLDAHVTILASSDFWLTHPSATVEVNVTILTLKNGRGGGLCNWEAAFGLKIVFCQVCDTQDVVGGQCWEVESGVELEEEEEKEEELEEK